MAIFEGAGVAIVTPMNEDLSVNYEKLAELLDEQIAGGTSAGQPESLPPSQFRSIWM